jgi:hypothetical protein
MTKKSAKVDDASVLRQLTKEVREFRAHLLALPLTVRGLVLTELLGLAAISQSNHSASGTDNDS